MFILFLIGIGFLGFATILLLRGATMNRVRTGESLAQIDGYGYVSHDVVEEGAVSDLRLTLDQMAAALGRIVPTRFGGGARSIRRQLMTAGIYSITPSKFMGYRVLCMFVWVGGWILLGILGFHGGAVSVLGVLGLAFAGWLAPVRFVKAKGKRRKAQIEKELPELIDLLVVTIEGGVGFTASLRMAAERLRGPIGEELRLVLQEQRMGLSTDEALRNLLDRCDTPSVRSFVRSVLQGETPRRLDRPDHAQSGARDAQASTRCGRGASAEGTGEDALPADLPHLPGDVRGHPRPGLLRARRRLRLELSSLTASQPASRRG